MNTLNQFSSVLVFAVVAVLFTLIPIFIAYILAPRTKGAKTLATYECGIEPKTDARDRYSIKYYLVAMLFVIFDVETVFMYPWAVILDELAWFGLIEILVFLFILVTGYFYAWREGALDWA